MAFVWITHFFESVYSDFKDFSKCITYGLQRIANLREIFYTDGVKIFVFGQFYLHDNENKGDLLKA